MKMKFRPFTALLLIILLLAGVCTALFHMGFFDAFFAEKVEVSQQQEGEGPVVRREVSKIVLPLESAKSTAPDVAEELNEADISGQEPTVTQPSPVVEKKEEVVSVAEKPVAKPEVAEPKAVETKVVEQKKIAAKPSKSSVSKRTISKVSFSCESAKASVDVALSAAPGKVSWFNLDKPRRLVMDIHGKWQNKAKSLYRLKDCPVQKIVLGEHPDKIRVVVYLDEKVVPAKIKPGIRKHDKGLSFDLGF
ncbi:AMIN domain-containing protein [Maridesulfovibrio sp.]|uniref:AMIN domain-containing protein n=1 Tax=Maridesulfovibrio sp. TaxID=2795000 RepID=UPI002A1888EA|nr:AMIN domain-containing protein [Maridesulfovibrio sp.]